MIKSEGMVPYWLEERRKEELETKRGGIMGAHFAQMPFVDVLGVVRRSR